MEQLISTFSYSYSKAILNYCCNCGSKLKCYVPEGDLLERSICDECETVYYDNPKILVASIVNCNNKVLLCKRAIKPRLGFWTLPSGYMENDETILEAAIRETKEETTVSVNKLHLYAVFSCPDINQVYFIFRGNADNEEACSTDESLEAKYFYKDAIPWDALSYSIMNKSLQWYFNDNEQGEYCFRMLDVFGCDPEMRK